MQIELIPNHPANATEQQDNQNSIFTFPETGQTVRVMIKDGEPWFVGKDVCNVLGLVNNRKAMYALEDDEKGVTQSYTLGGMQNITIISEAGFYRLVLRSDKPIAKPFQRWVTHDVLPSIRKTGGYIHATPDESPEMIMAKALRVADETIKRQRAQLEAVKPTIAKYNTFLNTEGTLSLTEVAKHFDMTAKQLGKMLRSNDIHWLYRNMRNTNIPTKEAIDEGYAIVVSRRHRDTGLLMSQARITTKGMDELHYLLK
nr:MAG TPA: repressor domain protein [Caudoviricetes sp.]